MTSSRDLRSLVTEAVTCSICLELFKNPKSLPCLHTFCLKCIEGHCRDKETGIEVACPVCRQKFRIPENGAHGLLNNFFVADLVEARKIASDVVIPVPCDECLVTLQHQDGICIPRSTVYCVDCNQTLCEKCSRPHKRTKDGPHKMVKIARHVATDLTETQREKCDKHNSDDARMFCFDCAVNICMACFASEHKQHSCTNMDKVAIECVKHIDADLQTVKEQVVKARKVLCCLEDEKRKFLAGVEEIGEKIVEMVEELKQQIDKQVNDLLLELQSLQKETCKKIESHKDNVVSTLSDLETFSEHCNDVKCNTDPCDITRAARDLHVRVTELLRSSEFVDIESGYCAPTLQFEPDGVLKFLGRPKIPLGSLSSKFEVSNCDEEQFKLRLGQLSRVATAGFDHPPPLNRITQSGNNNGHGSFVYLGQPRVFLPYQRPTGIMPVAMVDAQQMVPKYPYNTVQLAPMVPVSPPMSGVPNAGHKRQTAVPSNVGMTVQQGRQRSMVPMYTNRNITPRFQAMSVPPPPAPPATTAAVYLAPPLTAILLAQNPPIEQKQMLGERLFPLIHDMHPDIAGKITGMLLELDNSELLHFLECRESLKSKVEEAIAVIHAYQESLESRVD